MDTHGRTLARGSRVGAYQIVSHLGTGGMAEVYQAVHVVTGQQVALKVLASPQRLPPQASSRFALEVLAISAVRHPNVVTILEVDLEARPPFIAMEYVPGRTLRQLLAKGPVPVPTALRVAARIADGLVATHAAGIVHRDLKPENVMVTPEGKIKILDFGLSKSLRKRGSSEESLTLPGMLLGTLAYMSPEQASGRRADFRCDQFALGAILYEMLTGVLAFQRKTIPTTHAAVIEEEPAGWETFRTSAPHDVLSIVERALAKSPDARYASMVAMRTALVDSMRRHERSFIARVFHRAASALRRGSTPSGSDHPSRPFDRTEKIA